MEYKVITAERPDDLARRVNSYIMDGWTLQGGVSVGLCGYIGNDGFVEYGESFAQAIIKEAKNETINNT